MKTPALEKLIATELNRGHELRAKVAQKKENNPYRLYFHDDRLARVCEVLVLAVQNYLHGDYLNPRSNRPHECKHGTPYYEECEGCNDEHFSAALTRAEAIAKGEGCDDWRKTRGILKDYV